VSGAFHRFGASVARHPRRWLAAWAVAIALGAWGAHNFPAAAIGGSTGLAGSPSKAVDDALQTEFSDPFLQSVAIAVASPGLTADAAPMRAWQRDVAAALRGRAEVRAVADYAETPLAELRSADGHSSELLVGLSDTSLREQQLAVPRIRAALEPFRARLAALDPQAQLAVTGAPAVTYDINSSSAAGGDRGEKHALPLTLFILIVAFGTLVAAALPFLTGLATTTVALGLAYLLAQLMPVSNLLGNVVTMIGLAVGIDYSLLMVKDFRERRLSLATAEALAATVEAAGTTICWSGSTVAIGLLGLLWSPLLETRSVGIGGALVVLVSMLAALTLLPACLALIGHRIEYGKVLRFAPAAAGHESLWRRIAARTVRRPVISLLLSGGAVVLLALPVAGSRSGFSSEPWYLPAGMESRVGAQILNHIRHEDPTRMIDVVLRTADGSAVLADSNRAALLAYSDRLSADTRIAALVAPFDRGNGARLDSAHLSRDGRAALLELAPAERLSLPQVQALAREVGALAPQAPLTATVGGRPVYYNDFDQYLWRSFPKVFGSVVAATLLLLYCAFRSLLLPVKAVIANLLAIAAGYGVVVAIFQFGWLHALVGLERPFAAIALEVPLMIFCLSFGLSMDYELFLLFRIRREYLVDGDNDRATVAGLAAVAPVITGAGLIMAVVFGAFVGADLPAVKMIGVGLCAAVLVDATLIRGFVVPAFMSIAGRWNWYPGSRRAAALAPRSPIEDSTPSDMRGS
jgi:RND superfamily putative drug exporter